MEKANAIRTGRRSAFGPKIWGLLCMVCMCQTTLFVQVGFSQKMDLPLVEARHLVHLGYYKEAEPLLETAIRNYGVIPAQDQELEAYFLLEEVEDLLYQNEKRQKVLNDLQRITRDYCGDNSPRHIEAQFRQVDYYIDIAQSAKAWELLETDLARFDSTGAPEHRARYFLDRGRCFLRKYDWLRAEEAYRTALRIAEVELPIGSRVRSRFLQEVSMFFSEQGLLDEAIAITNGRLQTLRSKGNLSTLDSMDIAYCHVNLTGFYSGRGFNTLAIEQGDKAIVLFRSIKSCPKKHIGIALSYKFFSYAGPGGGDELLSQAINTCIQAEALLRESDDRNAAYAYFINYANLVGFIGYDLQSKYSIEFKKALEVAEKWGIDPHFWYLVSAGIEVEKGNYEEAIQHCEASFQAYETEYGVREYALILRGFSNNDMAITYKVMEEWDSVIHYSQRGMQDFTPGFRSDDWSKNPLPEDGCTRIYLLDIILYKSQALYEKYESMRGRGSEYLEMSFHANLSGLRIAEALRERYEGDESYIELSGRTLKHREGLVRSGIRLYEETGKVYYLIAAFNASEQAKGSLILAEQSQSQVRNANFLPEKVVRTKDSLEVRVAQVKGALLDEEDKGTAQDSAYVIRLKQESATLRRELMNWEQEVKENFPEYGEFTQQNGFILTPKDWSNWLEDGEAMVEFFVGEEELYTFFLNGDHLSAHRAPLPDDFDEKVTRFVRSINDYGFIMDSVSQSYPEYITLGHELYQFLLEPVLSKSVALDRLIIVPDKQLHQIPFEALLTQKADSNVVDYTSLPYLIRDHKMWYAFSGNSLHQSRQVQATGTSINCLALAPEYGDGSMLAQRGDIASLRNSHAELEGAQLEVKTLSELGISGEFLFGREATEQNFKSLAPSFNLLHLAMHGSADSTQPDRSKLIFTETAMESSEDNILYAYELNSIPFRADLVVLSACETGVGKYVSGEGIMSLGRGLIANGSNAVVMTLWSVEDRSSASLMQSFYTELVEEGNPADEALHQAKLQQLKLADSRTAHPYFWAGYIGSGSPGELDFSAPVQQYCWLFLIGLAVVLLGFWIWRKKSAPKGQ